MLHVKDLSVSYGNVEVLHQLNFSMERGSILSVMGRNGVGKTTLMKSVVGLLKPTSGEILYEDNNVTNLPAYKRVLKGIGYVPQGRHIFPKITVEENLKTGLRGKAKADFGEVYDYFPVLKEMAGRSGGDLSGGQQQQLAIGRALVTQPELLILDEPTEGIQPNIIQRIGEVLNVLSKEKGMTILIVEQYLDFIKEFSTDFLLMNRGTVMESGKTENLSGKMIEDYLHV